MLNFLPDEIRLLLDENISHLIAARLAEEGIDALPVAHRGLSGASDHHIFQFAQKEGRAVATINECDFEKLAAKVSVHFGVIVIPSGGSREEQYYYLTILAHHLRLTPPAMAAVKDRIVVIDQELKICTQTTRAPSADMPVVATAVRLKPTA